MRTQKKLNRKLIRSNRFFPVQRGHTKWNHVNLVGSGPNLKVVKGLKGQGKLIEGEKADS